jgi:hypothetical protein
LQALALVFRPIAIELVENKNADALVPIATEHAAWQKNEA